MRTLKAGLLYFVVVFGAGFVLGTMRVLWLVPSLGERTAELMEMPIMLGVIVVATRWVVRLFSVPPLPWRRLGMGLFAVGLLILAELAMILKLRGPSLGDYFASRDPVSGSVFLVMLVLMAVMPLLVARR